MAAILDLAMEVLAGAKTEIGIFLVAFVVHSLIFGRYSLRLTPKSKLHVGVEKVKTPMSHGGQQRRAAAAAAGQRSPLVAPLVRAVRPLLGSQEEVARELSQHLEKSAPTEVGEVLAGLVEVVGRAATPELLAAVRAELHSRCICVGPVATSRARELLLQAYLGLRMQSEFEELLFEVEAEGCVTEGMALLALRAALLKSDLGGALEQLPRLAAPLRTGTFSGGFNGRAPSATPQTFLQQLTRLAIERNAVSELLEELRSEGLCRAWTLEAVLLECARAGDPASVKAARALADAEGVELTAAAYGALFRSASGPGEAAGLFAEAVQRGRANKELLLEAADTALTIGDAVLAAAVLRQQPPGQAPEVVQRFVRLIADFPAQGQDGDNVVLALFERHLAGTNILGSDTRAGQLVVEAGLRRGRADIVVKVLAASESIQQHALLKTLGRKNGLNASLEVFKACPEKNPSLYNALLEACNICHDLPSAEQVMEEATEAGMADVVTYNTLMKAYAQAGDLKRAHATIEKMRCLGGAIAPNCVTFNELIDATVRCNGGAGVWALVDEMKACGISPNHVTCAILLKSIQRGSRPRDVERTLAVMASMEDAVDEVLLSSACEACVRANRMDLLARVLERQRGPRKIMLKGAHCFGSILRAYGFLGDLRGAWTTWREMRAQRTVLTSVTIGCMVEALVTNGDAEAGYDLIHEMLADPEGKPLVNAVIYCSVLKGFSHQKKFDRVWAVYDEMIAGKVPFSVTSYNALIDACARSCDMGRVQELLSDMSRQQIQPNVVTYSTIVKGYCQEAVVSKCSWSKENSLDKAFDLLAEMKKSTDFKPDEITYNTVIDGCARYGLFDKGVAVVQEMQEYGVQPSNFTLSVLVKLCTRSKRPEKAFGLCDALVQKYSLQPNVQVYNNLIHACTSIKDMEHAIQVMEQMLSEGVRTDSRTYTLLVKGYLADGCLDEALALCHTALGLPGGHKRLTRFDAKAKPAGGLPNELVTEATEALAERRGTEAALRALRELRHAPGLKVDPKLQMRLTSTAMRTPARV